MPARGECGGDLRLVQDRIARGRGGNHHVGFGQVTIEFGQPQCVTAVTRGQILRVGEGAVGDEQTLRRGLHQVARGQFDGFAGADQQHGGLLQSRERFLRQAHRGGRDRHRVRADARVGTCPLRRGKGVLEQAIELAAEAAGGTRRRPGIFHLAQDLRLAQYQRIQSGGDAEQVAHGIGVGVLVEIGVQIAGIVRMGREPVGEAATVVIGDGVEFGAVAGRQQCDFAHRRQAAQCIERRRNGIAGKRHALAQADRRGLVIDAENKQTHYDAGEHPVQGLALSWL